MLLDPEWRQPAGGCLAQRRNMPGISEDGSAAAPDVSRVGGCITYRKRSIGSKKERGIGMPSGMNGTENRNGVKGRQKLKEEGKL